LYFEIDTYLNFVISYVGKLFVERLSLEIANASVYQDKFDKRRIMIRHMVSGFV
jgi:hypothetical protein